MNTTKETHMKARKVYMLADGRFGVDTVDLHDMSVGSALEQLGISRASMSHMDTTSIVDGCVCIEIAMQRAFTWNRFVFCKAVDEVA